MGMYTSGNMCEPCTNRLLAEHNMEFAEFTITASEAPCVICGTRCGHPMAMRPSDVRGGVYSFPEDCIPRLRQKLGFTDGV